MKGELPGQWSPILTDPVLSEEIKAWGTTLSSILKMDRAGNIFKQDPVNTGFKKGDTLGEFLKQEQEQDDLDVDAVRAMKQAAQTAVEEAVVSSQKSALERYGRRAQRDAVQTVVVTPTGTDSSMGGMDMAGMATTSTSGDIRPSRFLDMYDPYPLSPLYPHGHVELLHMYQDEVAPASALAGENRKKAGKIATSQNLSGHCVPDPSLASTGDSDANGGPIQRTGAASSLSISVGNVVAWMATAFVMMKLR
jgi:hypothetical protein